MENFKDKIIDYIEGRSDPETFFMWFESNSQVFAWLQSIIPSDKTIDDIVDEKFDYFLKNLPREKQDEIYSAYKNLCENIEIGNAKLLTDLLYNIDAETVHFTDFMNLLINNYKRVFDNPNKYKPSYVQEMCYSIKDFFEKEHPTVQSVPYDVKKVFLNNKSKSKIWSYVNVQSWLYALMTELFPEEFITENKYLYEKASFITDVCPEYIEGPEIDEAGIIEAIIEQVPETISKGKRMKQIKELIKKEFHVDGSKYPRWIQGGEWPLSKSGKPMRFIEQKRKKSKEYSEMLYTQFFFEDVDTGEIRVIDQYT